MEISPFRRSVNVEDRRRDAPIDLHAWPRNDLMLPNVFEDGGGTMEKLNADTDFVPQPANPTPLSVAAGVNNIAGGATPVERYNTPLTPDEQQKFLAWGANQPRAPQQEMQDYDLQGWWKANPGSDLSVGHLTDQWKKPNHPTFSDQSMYHGVDGHEGGKWVELGGDKYSFLPGRTNFDHHKIQDMQQYFQKVEPGNTLDVSSYPTEPGYMPAWMTK